MMEVLVTHRNRQYYYKLQRFGVQSGNDGVPHSKHNFVDYKR